MLNYIVYYRLDGVPMNLTFSSSGNTYEELVISAKTQILKYLEAANLNGNIVIDDIQKV